MSKRVFGLIVETSDSESFESRLEKMQGFVDELIESNRAFSADMETLRKKLGLLPIDFERLRDSGFRGLESMMGDKWKAEAAELRRKLDTLQANLEQVGDDVLESLSLGTVEVVEYPKADEIVSSMMKVLEEALGEE